MIHAKIGMMFKPYKQVFVGLALLLTLLALSCVHTNYYAEPSGPASETAVLQANVPAWIVSIDGQSVSYRLTGAGRTTKVTAGPHTIQVSYKEMETQIKSEHGEMSPNMKSRRLIGMAYVPLNLVAKPGHTYFIRARRDDINKKWYPTITDFAPVNPAAPGKQ